jgi:hypothetical protein
LSPLAVPQIELRYAVVPDVCALHGVPARHPVPLREYPGAHAKSHAAPVHTALAFAGAVVHVVSVGEYEHEPALHVPTAEYVRSVVAFKHAVAGA